MTKFRKSLVWFYMLTKRILHKWSFLLLLCMIPLIIPMTNLAMSQESGIVRIVLCNEGNDEEANKIIQSLLEEDSVIMFTTAETAEEAEEAIHKYQADATWIFASDFSDNLDAYTANKPIDHSFVRVIERENTITIRIAREKLFGALYSNLSYSIYKNFIYGEIASEETVSETTVREYYDSARRRNNIIKIEKLHGENSPKTGEVNYLTAPIRGILALLIMLCGITAAMYFLNDQSQGRFDWLPPKKRIVPALATCFSATCLSALAVFIAISCTKIATGFFRELIPMLLYLLTVTGFCTLLCLFFRSPGKLGALIPGIIIAMLVLSPIFFNVKVLRPIRLMLPTYYYLHAIYNTSYYLYSLLYIAVLYLLIFVVNNCITNRKQNKSII